MFFSGELKKAELVEARLNRQLRERSNDLEVLRKKGIAQEEHLQSVITRNDDTVSKLKKQVQVIIFLRWHIRMHMYACVDLLCPPSCM